MKGAPITSVEELYDLALAKGSVVCPYSQGDKHRPAAILINWNAAHLVSLIRLSGLFRYEKQQAVKAKGETQ